MYVCGWQEVARRAADSNKVCSDNKGKGGARSFILFGLASGNAIVSLTPWWKLYLIWSPDTWNATRNPTLNLLLLSLLLLCVHKRASLVLQHILAPKKLILTMNWSCPKPANVSLVMSTLPHLPSGYVNVELWIIQTQTCTDVPHSTLYITASSHVYLPVKQMDGNHCWLVAFTSKTNVGTTQTGKNVIETLARKTRPPYCILTSRGFPSN